MTHFESGNHELVAGTEGRASVRYLPSGEAMHSYIGPWQEANLLYISQGRLAERLVQDDSSPLVIYDLGLGIAANSVAALECLKKIKPRRQLKIISFENDLSGIELGLSRLDLFPFLEPYKEPLKTLLKQGNYRSYDNLFEWELKTGDFLSHSLEGSAPELIFFDFYSPKTSPDLWTEACFRKLRAACERRAAEGKSSVLLTYSAATAVRSALILAGFYVGYGASTPVKLGTTIASTSLSEIDRPLDQRWVEKFENSTKPLPKDWPMREFAKARAEIIKAVKSFYPAPHETTTTP